MPSARSQRSSTTVHAADQKLLRTKDVVIHMSQEKISKCRCCGKRLMALPMLGFTLFSIACLLGVGYYSIHRVTSSVYHTEGVVPSYATAGVLVAAGLQLMLMFKTHSRCLVVSSIIFTLAAGLLCFAGALYAGTDVAPLLSGIESCQYYPVETSCKCFHHSELRQVSIIFRDTVKLECNGIQYKLTNLVYGMSGVYGGGFVTCIIAAVMETLLLCRKTSKATLHSRSDGDGKCTVNSRQSQTSQTDLSVIEEEDNDDDEEKEEEEDEEEEEEEVAGESEGTAEMQRPAIETQTSQSPSTFVREVPCSHYVVDLSIPRRDYVINYNSNSRHDPPPPYSEM